MESFAMNCGSILGVCTPDGGALVPVRRRWARGPPGRGRRRHLRQQRPPQQPQPALALLLQPTEAQRKNLSIKQTLY